MTQLLVILEQWTELLDGGDHVNVIYFDFRKAFDTIIKKRKICGIKGSHLTWIETFLSGRRPCVMLNGKLCTWEEIISGIHTIRQ